MFAVLHLADFGLQALLRTEPAPLAEAPLALLDPQARPARILACTPAARALGVTPGQSSAQALARCATLRLLPPRPDAEAEARAALLAAAFTLSPAVEATAPGLCTIDITALPPARREPALRQALQQVSALGLAATAGAGSTPLLALYAARHASPLLLVDNERAFLSRLPLAAADPPPELAPILAAWGLRSLGDLTDLSKASVAQRLGPAGLALWERAAGQTSRPLLIETPPPLFAAELTLEHALETLEPLLFLLRRFVDRLALELHTASLATDEILLSLPLADETRHTRALKLPEPTTRPEILFAALQTHLETLRTASPVVGLRLQLTPARAAPRQSGLFDRALRDPHGFAETLARLASLVGADRVGTPAPRDTHRPDAFTLAPPHADIPPLPPGLRHPPQGLVLRRYRPARPVHVRLHPDTHAPLALESPNLAGHIEARAGPWRASGDWWQADQHWWREEWDIQVADHGLYRLARCPEGWVLDGEYD